MDVTTSNVSGMIVNTIMRQRVAGKPDYEAFVPSRKSATTSQVFNFDNRSKATGFAMANAHRQNPAVVDVTARNERGDVLRTDVLTIPPGGHMFFNLGNNYAETNLQYGTVEFAPRPGGYFSVIGLRFNETSAITNIEMMIP